MPNSASKTGRWIVAALAVGMLLSVFYNVAVDNMPKGEVRKVEDYVPWSKETIAAAETLPVQSGGRIKPLSTFAGFTMLGLHGARSMEIEGANGKCTLSPTAWMLDTLFRPQFAARFPTFRIDNSAVLEAIGATPRAKLDRYSYADLEQSREKLFNLAKSYNSIPKEERDPLQSQIIALEYNIREYESLIGYFKFARYGVSLPGTAKDGSADRQVSVSMLMKTAPEINSQLDQQGNKLQPHLASLLQQIVDSANLAKFGLAIFPPADPHQSEWLTAGNSIMSVYGPDHVTDASLPIADIEALEETARLASGDEAAFRAQLISLRDDIVKRATARGEYKHVLLEADYYRKDWFLNAMVVFILGTVTALAMWTVGQGKAGKVLSWATLACSITGWALCVIPIVERCIIMRRPPVGNLYDTIIFIATNIVFIALVVEWMTRRRFALGIAPILGTLLIILARRFELGDAKDNMDPLVAVLNSNYWLTIHVLTITLGYTAGLLSAFLAFVYLLMRGLGLDNGDRDIRRSLTRAVYGMVCLTLFLSLIGTVLGGIWANDSWGRFWGWDPKENGALLIVLWTLSILHARLGGFIREWGLHLAAVFTGAVVTFSWWNVNFLGVGLHNYGFTAGKQTLWVAYGVILAILCYGFIVMMLDKSAKAARGKLGNGNGSMDPIPEIPRDSLS